MLHGAVSWLELCPLSLLVLTDEWICVQGDSHCLSQTKAGSIPAGLDDEPKTRREDTRIKITAYTLTTHSPTNLNNTSASRPRVQVSPCLVSSVVWWLTHCVVQTFMLCPPVCIVWVFLCLISTAESVPFGPRGTEARYCVKQSGVETHKHPQMFSYSTFAVGEINNCGLRSGFSSLSWPFHLSSSYWAVVYFTAQKKQILSQLYLDSDISVVSCTDSGV